MSYRVNMMQSGGSGMASVCVERLDHLGVVASVIKDLGIVEKVDARLGLHDQEEITAGEAIAGMILNGLGFSDRPLTLTPQFFVNKPLDLLFREGVRAEMLNRFKLGRTLDEAHAYGCDLLFSELSLAVCAQERIDTRFHHLDTPSFFHTEDYVPDSDEHAIAITYGYSKDQRPDLKQAVLELMVSQDGGVPLMSQSWDGNASDTKIFQERAQALITTFRASPSPRYVVADAKLYSEENTANLKKLGFITRVPGTLKLVTHVITQALGGDTLMRRRVIRPSNYATMAWPSGGWSCGHRPPMSAQWRALTKPVDVKRRRSPNNSFTCKRSALRRPPRRTRRSRGWR